MTCWGFGRATDGDGLFRQLVLARMIEPVSKSLMILWSPVLLLRFPGPPGPPDRANDFAACSSAPEEFNRTFASAED